jgi:hypothetical protein
MNSLLFFNQAASSDGVIQSCSYSGTILFVLVIIALLMSYQISLLRRDDNVPMASFKSFAEDQSKQWKQHDKQWQSQIVTNPEITQQLRVHNMRFDAMDKRFTRLKEDIHDIKVELKGIEYRSKEQDLKNKVIENKISSLEHEVRMIYLG